MLCLAAFYYIRRSILPRYASFYAFLCIVIIMSTGHAQDEEGFSGRAGLGYIATNGNSESRSLNADFSSWWNYDSWSHSLSGLTIKSSASNTTTAEAYSLAWQNSYAINDTDYLYGIIALDKNHFSTYNQQTREAIGYGRRFINLANHFLDGEIGVGIRQATLSNDQDQDETILRLSGDYRWIVSETSEFTQTLALEGGSENIYIEMVSALSANVRENLALVTSYTIRNNTDVLPGTEKTDIFTAISLEYIF